MQDACLLQALEDEAGGSLIFCSGGHEKQNRLSPISNGSAQSARRPYEEK
jgi:hypothetical protein